MKTGILLLNLGTPDSPAVGDVRKYLREFLMDPRVIDINPVSRWFLINFIIAPLRAPKSAKLYESIWTKEGSPLLIHGKSLQAKLSGSLGENYHVAFGMRYQSPSLKNALLELRDKGVDRIIALPLYPQYSSAATGSTIDAINAAKKKIAGLPEIKIIERFHHLPEYMDALIETASGFDHRNYDHVLFSFHGVPERQITKTSHELGDGKCSFGSCCEVITQRNQYCYRANCVQTARTIAERLSIPKEQYTICFQSRLGRTPWLQPFSDQVIADLAKQGKKKLLVFSPAFVADCLETIHEIGVEYNELFREHGGEHVQLVPSLNSSEKWVEGLKNILAKY
ncbi:MAG TPA: ferrochelatase [Bacteroidia bacterium]|nr:ferrochelatase [Bacteroidia bacterium]